MAYTKIEKLAVLTKYKKNWCNVSKTIREFRQEFDHTSFSRETFYVWLKTDPYFATKEEEIRWEILDYAEERIVRNALEKNNVTAIIFYLKYRHPDYRG